MRITHSDAITLEYIARKVHNCERFEMGGLINADHFESYPFDAALIALAPVWKQIDSNSLDDFFCRWKSVLCNDEDFDEETISSYINELQKLVDSAMN